MARLSVNINKFATLRNARGGDNPNIITAARKAELFGAQGITIHPRPDERHIRYQDARDLKAVVTTELNIEGNPKETRFIDLVLEVKPDQVTLVPDATNALTSNQGWDCISHADYLKQTIALFKQAGIRTSIFLDPVVEQVIAAKDTGTDRIELYTERYAHQYPHNPAEAVAPYQAAAAKAVSVGLGINAGHDLDLHNLAYFKRHIPGLMEVSIGHALVCDALYLGLEETIKRYKLSLQ